MIAGDRRLISFARLDDYPERNVLGIALALLPVFVAVPSILPFTVPPGELAMIRGRFRGTTMADRVYLESRADPAPSQGALPSLPTEGMSLPFSNHRPSDAQTHH
jgi:hypothetical protein